MAESKQEDNKIVDVNGLEIRRKSLYKIAHKLDMSAPDGFIKAGATKLPSEEIADSVPCRFVVQNETTKAGVFDTGFYIGSPCYQGLDEKTKKDIVNVLQREIVTPYERMYGEGTLNQMNSEFWDNFSVKLSEGRVFNTEKIEDLLDLYISVHGFSLTPISKDASPQFKGSSFIVEDNLASVSVHKKRNSQRFSAVTNFMSLLKIDKKKLIVLLVYLKALRPNYVPSEDDLKEIFDVWLNKDVQNPALFESLYEKASTDDGILEITLTVNVSKWITGGKLPRLGNQYTYQNVELGIDARSIASNLVNTPELAEIRDEILLS